MIKLIQLKAAEVSLIKLLNADLPVKEAYRLSKMAKRISEELVHAEKIRNDLVIKYGAKQEDSSLKVMPPNMEVFIKEYNELLEEEVDIPIVKVNLSQLDGAKLSPVDINNLDFILEE